MKEQNTSWGLYPWFEEYGEEMLHPDDVHIMRKLMPNGKIFRLAGNEGAFVRLQYGEIEVRVQPSLFKPVDAKVRAIGQTVTLKDGRSGEVVGIQWHYQRSEPMYQLRVDGKKKSNRYWESDFE